VRRFDAGRYALTLVLIAASGMRIPEGSMTSGPHGMGLRTPLPELRHRAPAAVTLRRAAIARPRRFGAWAKPRPVDPVVTGDRGRDAVLHLEAEIGRRVTMDHVYYHFDDVWPGSRQAWDRENGRLPLINWSPEDPIITWNQIASGRADPIIDARAAKAKRFGSRILLAFHHEPEDDTARYGTPAAYRSAWRHIVSRFRREGATNVRFVLILTADTYAHARAGRWYPGSRVIDYVGADGYNWFGTRENATWRGLGRIFGSFSRWSLEKRKRAIIAETGCLEDPNDPQRKARWFAGARAWLARRPNIRAFVYFNSDRRWPWWVDSSPASLAAFAELANSPIFSGLER
jgi:hypothetical protein